MKSPFAYLKKLRAIIQDLQTYLARADSWSRLNMSIARGAAASGLRMIDATDPRTWEFSGFSQNGEDGIIDHLLNGLTSQNRYFVEIGCSNGLENNSSWLAIVRRFSGLMIDGDMESVNKCKHNLSSLNWGLNIVELRVTKETVAEMQSLVLHKNPDVFSLDIDGLDYYVMEHVIGSGIKPKIVVVEYNSALGPVESRTVNYKPDFDISKEHPSRMYYGVSIAAWKRFFLRQGYAFITVEQNGVNAFFVDPSQFRPGFLEKISSLQFQENFAQFRQHGFGWEGQLQMLCDCSFVEIP